jgi:hypothetical protein
VADAQGVIGHVEVDGFPVLYRYIDETPSDEKRAQLPWLTVVAWTYDRSVRNGMPPEEVNARMVDLEERLEASVEAPGVCEHIVSKTGNGLKELIYYINDRDVFSERLNAALTGQPRYPIDITFYHDPEWQEFSMTRSLFDEAAAGSD